MFTNPRLSERHASLLADDRARADYSNPRLSERHASLFEDDRARADYSYQKAVFGQVVGVNSYIVAIPFCTTKLKYCQVAFALFPTHFLPSDANHSIYDPFYQAKYELSRKKLQKNLEESKKRLTFAALFEKLGRLAQLV